VLRDKCWATDQPIQRLRRPGQPHSVANILVDHLGRGRGLAPNRNEGSPGVMNALIVDSGSCSW